MTDAHDQVLGYLKIKPYKAFADPSWGLPRPSSIWELPEPAPQDKVSEWPRVRRANRYNGQFLIEAVTGRFTASLRFDPDQPTDGFYEIHHLPHGKRETGSTERIIVVDENVLKSEPAQFSALEPFPIRYALTTVRGERPHDRLAWLIGLNNVQIISDDAAYAE